MNAIPPKKNSAMTLIEILVTAGLICMLMLLALPVLGRLRLAGKAVQNLGNHRQIAAALIAYAGDHKGSLPFSYESKEVSPSGEKVTYPRTLCTLGYVTDPAIFFSPLQTSRWYQGKAYFNPKSDSVSPWFYTNYGANRYGAMPYNEKGYFPANLIQVGVDGNISRLMLTRDTYNPEYDTAENPYGGGLVWFSETSYLPPEERTYNGIIHTSYADGHVEPISLKSYRSEIENAALNGSPLFVRRYTVR